MLVTECGALPDKHRKRNREFQNASFLEEMRISMLCFLALIIPHPKKVRGKKWGKRLDFSFALKSSTEWEYIHDKPICFK